MISTSQMRVCSFCLQSVRDVVSTKDTIHIRHVQNVAKVQKISLDYLAVVFACKHIFHMRCLLSFSKLRTGTVIPCPFEDRIALFEWKEPLTGGTMLHHAIHTKNIKLLKNILIHAESLIFVPDASGNTPFQLAIMKVEQSRRNLFGFVDPDHNFIASCIGPQRRHEIQLNRLGSKSSNIEFVLQQLSQSAKLFLEIFFKLFIFDNHALHVIFFDTKPVSMATFRDNQEKSFGDVIEFKSLQVFKEKQAHFPHPNFIFSEHQIDTEEIWFFMINKSSLAKFLNKHRGLFEQRLGASFSMDNFILNLKAGTPLLTLLNHDEFLLYLLLGYGAESSKTYLECQQSETATFCPIDINVPAGCTIKPMNFLANPQSQETQELRSSYERELHEFWAQYNQQGHHLRWILETICDFD